MAHQTWDRRKKDLCKTVAKNLSSVHAAISVAQNASSEATDASEHGNVSTTMKAILVENDGLRKSVSTARG